MSARSSLSSSNFTIGSDESQHNDVQSESPDGIQKYERDSDSSNKLEQPSSLLRTYSKKIISRTSTIITAIRDDNEYAVQEENKNKNVDPVDDIISRSASRISNQTNKNDVEVVQSKLSSYDGEYNEKDIIDRPPDGTLTGWIAVLCITLVNTFSWGANTSYGVLLNYYIKSDHFPGATREEYALIGGLDLGFSFVACTLANSLVRRFYYKYIMTTGVLIIIVCYFAAAEVKTITQFIMVQGLLLSIGYALAAAPTLIVTPTWFLKKRSFVNGITSGGAGIAGLIFSRPIQALIDKTHGYKWPLRMVGLVSGVILIGSTIAVRCRRDMRVKSDKPFLKEFFQSLIRTDIYHQPAIVCLIIWNFIYGICYTILLFSLSSYSSSIGLTDTQGAMVTTIQSLAQTIGRPALGYFSAMWGKANVTIVATFILGILSMTYWIFVESYGALIGYAFIAGFSMGVNWVNFVPMSADVVGGGDDLLAALTALYLTGGPPLIVSEIIGLKLERPHSKRPYLYCQILVGIVCIVSAIILLPFREWKIKRMFTARRQLIQKIDSTSRSDEDSKRLKRYDVLLEKNLKGYIFRMFYPIKA